MSETPLPATPPNRLRELAVAERPQERALARGVGALSDADLLALLLRSGTRGHDVMTLANRLLAEAGSLAALARWGDADFRRLKGIGRVKALQLCTVMEVARRVLGAERDLPPVLNTPQSIYDYLRARALGASVEKSWVVSLNSRNRVLRCVELSSGTTNTTLVSPSLVLREVLRDAGTAFVLAHNHPSGDPAPSSADYRVTRDLRAAAEAVGLVFHDHLVLGDPLADPNGVGYYSFRAGGSL